MGAVQQSIPKHFQFLKVNNGSHCTVVSLQRKKQNKNQTSHTNKKTSLNDRRGLGSYSMYVFSPRKGKMYFQKKLDTIKNTEKIKEKQNKKPHQNS